MKMIYKHCIVATLFFIGISDSNHAQTINRNKKVDLINMLSTLAEINPRDAMDFAKMIDSTTMYLINKNSLKYEEMGVCNAQDKKNAAEQDAFKAIVDHLLVLQESQNLVFKDFNKYPSEATMLNDYKKISDSLFTQRKVERISFVDQIMFVRLSRIKSEFYLKD